MAYNILSFKNLCKALFIEFISLAAAFLTNFLIKDNKSCAPERDIRFSMDLRIYYLSKNIFYLLDTLLISKENNLRHLYSGSFNLGVACTIYPAKYLLPGFATLPVQIMGAQGIIYTAGVTLRLLVEKNIANQTVKQHIALNQGKFFGGAAGIFLAALPSTGIDSPALYWSGEIFDVYKIRTEDESLLSILLSPKAVVPVQAFCSQVIKMSFRLSNTQITIPEFAIDSIVGSSYFIMMKALGTAIAIRQEDNTATVQNALDLQQMHAQPAVPSSENNQNDAITNDAVNVSLPPI